MSPKTKRKVPADWAKKGVAKLYPGYRIFIAKSYSFNSQILPQVQVGYDFPSKIISWVSSGSGQSWTFTVDHQCISTVKRFSLFIGCTHFPETSRVVLFTQVKTYVLLILKEMGCIWQLNLKCYTSLLIQMSNSTYFHFHSFHHRKHFR